MFKLNVDTALSLEYLNATLNWKAPKLKTKPNLRHTQFHQLYCVNAGYLNLWGDLSLKPKELLRRGKDLLVRNGRAAILVPYPESETYETRVAEAEEALKEAGFAQVEGKPGLTSATGNVLGTVVVGVNA